MSVGLFMILGSEELDIIVYGAKESIRVYLKHLLAFFDEGLGW